MWQMIPNHPGYEASSKGHIRSNLRNTPRTLKPGKATTGHLNVSLDGERVSVHRTVLETFVGPCPPGHEAAHRNGVASDNRLENLRWLGKRENRAERYLNGLNIREGVVAIRDLYASGCSVELISRMLGVGNVLQIVQGKLYSSLPGPTCSAAEFRRRRAGQIRTQRALGGTLKEIAERHGMSESGVSLIVNWKRHTGGNA